MKNIIKIFVAGLIGIGAISTTTLATVKNTVLSESANAAQHSANYDDYFYSGTYYSGIDFNAGNGLNGNLRKALTTLIKPSRTPNYSGSGSNTLSNTLQYADEDPTNSSNMVYFYSRNSVKKVNANPSSTWNREHVWPQSLSNNCWGQGDAGSDILHLRPTYEETNSSRGNLLYGYVTDSWMKTSKLVSGLTYGKKNGSYFEPLDSVKGDCARICMYVWVAWINYYGASQMPALTKVFSSYNTLMEWHMIDPPDELEANRNSEAQYYQGNRNPFVDHPELAWKIFGEKCYDSIVRKAQVVYPETIPEITNLTYTGTLTNTIGIDGTDFTPTGVTVYANYSDGSSVNVTNDVVWKKLNSLENYVTGYYGRKSLKISGITVNPYIKVTGIKFAQNKFECKVGDKLQLEASVLPENAINKSISYRSNNPDIATVDSNGLVTTLKAGKAAILAISAEGNKTAVCDILVQAPAGCTGSAISGSSILIFIAILGLGLLTLKKLKIKF